MAKIIELSNGMLLKMIGDCHLGRKFVSGVPMHRRGEREAMVMAQFRNELEPGEAEIVVQVGDVLDKAVVSYNVISDVADIIEQVADRNRDVSFHFIAGNHDLSKDVEKVSAFMILKRMLRHVGNVHFVTRPEVQARRQDSSLPVAFIGLVPFFPWGTSEEAIVELREGMDNVGASKLDAAFGHWDVGAYSGENLLPMNALADITNKVYTGHIHKAGIVVDTPEMYVEKLGSMQPFAHGEESDDLLYVTRTIQELDSLGEDYGNRCLRVVLSPGEDIPQVECLQLTIKRLTEDGQGEDIDVDFENFDMNALFTETLTEAGVSKGIQDKISEKMTALRGGM